MSTKRSLEQISCFKKRAKVTSGDDSKVDVFIKWASDSNLKLNEKVSIGKNGSCAQNGMIAIDNIKEGECLFEIPRSVLLHPKTSGIAHLIEAESDSLVGDSGWVPLLIALIYEYNNSESPWRQYLDLVPDFSELDLPIFWSSDERREELRGTGVCECVERDEMSMKTEYQTHVLPFIKKYPQHFPSNCHSFNFYKQMVAFVMSYSFTEPVPDGDDSSESESEDDSRDLSTNQNPPMMVPMADILNHVAKNNAHLDFGEESLQMVAIKDINKGEEVFNTYGELGNMHLLHMYGFAEPPANNQYDCVEISVLKFKAYLSSHCSPEMQFQDKYDALISKGAFSESDSLVFGPTSVLTEEEMGEIIKVLGFNAEQLQEYMDSDWVESYDISLTYEYIKESVPVEIKHLLAFMAEERRKEFLTTLEKEEEIASGALWEKLSRRQQYCLHLRYGQLKILGAFIDACA